MKLFFLLHLFAVTLPLIGQQTITISGQIKNPIAFEYNGEFQQESIQFYFDNLLLIDQDFTAVPDALGNFSITIPIDQPMPAYFEYGDDKGHLFWVPNEDLHIEFEAGDFRRTLLFSGKGAAYNRYFAETQRQFDRAVTENQLEARRETASFIAYKQSCQKVLQEEQTFLNQYLRNHKTPVAFQKWGKQELKYKHANRLTSYFYASIDKQNDGYRNFARQQLAQKPATILSNQYLIFIDNHLRQLCLRDTEELLLARKQARTPWMIRAFELAQTEFWGASRDYALGKLLLSLISMEQQEAVSLYRQFNKIAKDQFVRDIVGLKYDKLKQFMTAAAPINANLFVIDQNNPLSFKQLLNKYSGKVIYLDFWASWCAPCLSEMKYAVKLQKHYEGKDIVFVFLSSDKAEGLWKGNISRRNISGEHYLMSDQLEKEAYANLGVRALPHYAIVNKKGQVALNHAKHPSDESLKLDIDRLLKE